MIASMTTAYEYVKKWRNKNAKNRAHSKLYMRNQRRYYKERYNAGEIAYKDIPKAYRYFKA
jgi:hypothetical protein